MAEMKVKGTIDTRNYERGVNRMRKKNKEFGSGLGKVGKAIKKAFIAAAIIKVVQWIVRATRATMDWASSLNDSSRALSVNIERLQEWGRLVEDGGGKLKDLENAFNNVRDAQGRAADGDELVIDALKRLGIAAEEFIGLDTEGAAKRIAVALAESGKAANQMNAAGDILGKRTLKRVVNGFIDAANSMDDFEGSMFDVGERAAARLDIFGNKVRRTKEGIMAMWANSMAGAFNLFGALDEETDKSIENARELEKVEKRMREAAVKQFKAEQEKKRLDALRKIREEEEKITKQREEQFAKIRESIKIEIDTDQIRRIGGMVGRGVSEQLTVARMQEERARREEEYLRSLPAIEKNTQTNRGLQ
jgi:hypothetical protein